MAGPASSKKRKVLDSLQNKTSRPKKKFRKQLEYHSSSDDDEEEGGVDLEESTDFKAVNFADSDDDVEVPSAGPTTGKLKSLGTLGKKRSVKEDDGNPEDIDEDDEDENDDESHSDEFSDADDHSDVHSNRRAVSKRNDPAAFSTSISKILSTKLPTSARADPVLSRSKTATQTTSEIANEKLDKLARAKLRAEKKEGLDRGRIRDVMGIERGQAGGIAEEEKRLRKVAQRGVVKLFNAVRAAQVRGEQAAKQERKKGTIGIGERQKAVNEVSKQGFLELINGKKGKALNIEEA